MERATGDQHTSSRLDSCLRMLRAVVTTPNSNEEARKQMFISYLRPMFPGAQYESLIDNLAAGAESYIPSASTSASGTEWGFADTRSGHLVVEFKANLSSSLDDAEDELRRYFAGLWNDEGPHSSYCGIATDVVGWRVYRPLPETLDPVGHYTSDMVSLDLVETLQVSGCCEPEAKHLLLLLERVLFEQNLVRLTASNVRREFGVQSTQYAVVSPVIEDVIRKAREAPQARLMMDKWEQYQVYNARSMEDFDLDLYTKQVYLVILSRLIVAACLSSETGREIEDEAIRDILSGEFFHRRVRLANFVERDFFGWLISEPWIDDLLPLARPLYHHLQTYDFRNATAENVLRLIYDEMMPEEQRRWLGQRSTPESVVSPLIHSLIGDRDLGYRFLDPACGSGSLLRAVLLTAKREASDAGPLGQEEVSQLVDCATGIDVDPVAVIIAKAVWALTMSDILPHAARPVNIPVYHADSLFVVTTDASTMSGSGPAGELPEIAFDTASIEVPHQLFANAAAFDTLVDWCQQTAKALIQDKTESGDTTEDVDVGSIEDNLPRILGNNYSQELEDCRHLAARAAAKLVVELAKRIRDDRNGVWAFFLRNSYRPSLFAGRFDIAAANLPWLAMSRLPDIPYRDRLLHRAEQFGIRPSGSAAHHLEIATPFALRVVDHFLRESGQVGFVMPRSIFNGDQHHEFRAMQFLDEVGFWITRIWDLEGVEDLFDMPSCVLFAEKVAPGARAPVHSIPARFWDSLEPQDFREGNIVLASLGDKTAWMREDPEVPTAHSYGHYTSLFLQSADLMPRKAVFVDLVGANPDQDVVEVRTSQTEVENWRNKRFKDRTFHGRVNRRYLFTTLKSAQLVPFSVCEEYLPTVVLPIEKREDGFVVLSQQDLIARGDVGIAEWFHVIDSSEELGGKGMRERIDKRGKLTQQHYEDGDTLVHYGASGTIPCGAIQRIGPHTADLFIADQTTYVYRTRDEDEAYFLVGMLNAPVFGDLIRPWQSKGLYGPRHLHNLPADAMPPYDPHDARHQHLVEVSKAAEAKAQHVLVDKMCNPGKSLGRRRRWVREAIVDELELLNEIAKDILT